VAAEEGFNNTFRKGLGRLKYFDHSLLDELVLLLRVVLRCGESAGLMGERSFDDINREWAIRLRLGLEYLR
jgi:hypothetical protein